MPKFNWENGTKISESNVEINGNIFKVNPAQYEGKTPLSAQNLNDMQDAIYEDIWESTEISDDELDQYTQKEGYLANKENKQIFNGKIPRYENLLFDGIEEQMIGINEDGETVYRKKIVSNNFSDIDLSSLNFDDIEIVSAKLEHHYGEVDYIRFNGNYINNDDKFFVFIRNNAIRFLVGTVQSTNSTNIKITIVLKYTKKAD